jgi:hypothetical protein
MAGGAAAPPPPRCPSQLAATPSPRCLFSAHRPLAWGGTWRPAGESGHEWIPFSLQVLPSRILGEVLRLVDLGTLLQMELGPQAWQPGSGEQGLRPEKRLPGPG